LIDNISALAKRDSEAIRRLHPGSTIGPGTRKRKAQTAAEPATPAPRRRKQATA
jgi:hypothetical protein